MITKFRGLFVVLTICTSFAASRAGAAVFVPVVGMAEQNTVERTEFAKTEEVLTLKQALANEFQDNTNNEVDLEVLQAGMFAEVEALEEKLLDLQVQLKNLQDGTPASGMTVYVPFFSQFADIASPRWQKVGCGIASTAMLIEYYVPGQVSVEELLQQGIANNTFLSDAGWIHSGLINLTKRYGLNGESVSWASLSADAAFAKLTEVLKEGPVMASVHYTFEPTNPIPHLVVVSEVRDGMVYYNDPAEPQGGGSISKEKFQRAWKQRYIEIRPVS